METALAFPEPLPDDPEVVATALETAGIFGVQGDVREAVRWVRRAAELAGDAGIDERAFALARAAADLTTNFSGSAASSAPPAPPAAAAQPAAAESAPGRIASAPPPPPPPPVVQQSRASSRPQESRPPQQAVSVSPIVSLGLSSPQAAPAEDEAEITSQHPPHRARAPESAPPAEAAAQPAGPPGSDALAALFEEPLTPAQAGAPGPAPAAERAAMQQTLAYQTPAPEPALRAATERAAKFEEPPTPAIAPPEPTVRYPSSEAEPALGRQQPSPPSAESPRYGQHLTPTQVYEPVVPEAAFVEEPVPVMEAIIAAPELAAPSAASQASARQAARASVEQSQEEGVYILRLLKNGEAAAFGTFEALVVLVDPDAELFTGA